MASYRAVTDYQTNALSQLALANFITSGNFEKHVQRMRRIYVQKRRCLRNAIRKYNFPGELEGIESGINALVRLRPGVSATKISQQALRESICVTPVSRYAELKSTADNALVLGYGAVTEAQIEEGLEKLTTMVRNST